MHYERAIVALETHRAVRLARPNRIERRPKQGGQTSSHAAVRLTDMRTGGRPCRAAFVGDVCDIWLAVLDVPGPLQGRDIADLGLGVQHIGQRGAALDRDRDAPWATRGVSARRASYDWSFVSRAS